MSHVAVQFGLYEKAKEMAGEFPERHLRNSQSGRDGQPLTPTAILICSAFSKMIASLATYPHEVLRTRIQISKQQPSAAAAAASKQAALEAATAAATNAVIKGRTELYSPLVTGSNPPVPDSLAAETQAENAKRWRPRPGGIIDVFRKIYKQDGWRGFYRGLSINLVRTVPSSAVTMLTYELIMRNLSS